MPKITRDAGNRTTSLIYYMHDECAAFRFRLAGSLSEESTAELDQARQTASSVFKGRPLIVDLTGIENIDPAGREMIEKWHGLGARFVVATREAKERIQSMTEVPLGLLEKSSKSAAWLPGRAMGFILAAALLYLSVGGVR